MQPLPTPPKAEPISRLGYFIYTSDEERYLALQGPYWTLEEARERIHAHIDNPEELLADGWKSLSILGPVYIAEWPYPLLPLSGSSSEGDPDEISLRS